PNDIYNDTTTLFCISTSNQIVTTGFTTHDAATNPYPYKPECQRGTDNRYNLSIKYDGAASNDTFTVTALWDDVRGDGRDSVTLVYRVHAE
ncbi:MAG: hypothetical protein WA843_05190, partial [Candidatus Saccharimonadales bacterium]